METVYIWKMNADTSLSFVDMIENYSSLIWTKRFYTAGDFEIEVIDNKWLKYVGDDYIITKGKDKRNAMFIECANVSTDTERKTRYKLSGRCLLSLLDRRVLTKNKEINKEMSYEQVIQNLVSANVGSAAPTNRAIPNFHLAEIPQISDPIVINISPDSILNITSKLCQDAGIGQRIVTEVGGGLWHEILISQKKPVTFNRKVDNLTNSNYIKNLKSKVNAVYISDSSGNVQDIEPTPNPAGIYRRESVMSSNINRDDYSTEGDYMGALYVDGHHKINDSKEEAFECDVLADITYKYGVDYDIGDIVTVEDNGIKAKVRIVEIIESDGEAGHSIVPTFEVLEVL